MYLVYIMYMKYARHDLVCFLMLESSMLRPHAYTGLGIQLEHIAVETYYLDKITYKFIDNNKSTVGMAQA